MILAKEVCKLYIACCMLQTLAICAVTNTIFKQEDSVNGRVCPNIQRSFTKKADDIMVCSFHCSLDPSCKSLFYGRTSGICYGCNYTYTASSTLNTEQETIYYTNQEHDEHAHNVTNVRFSTIDGYSHRGRVEVYRDNSWGTVCDDDWEGSQGVKNNKVLCGMFGYSNGTVLTNDEVELSNATELPIWMDEVKCFGTESHIFNCQFLGFGPDGYDGCDHDEDIVVHCHN